MIHKDDPELTGWLSATVLDVKTEAAARLPSVGGVVEAAASGDEDVQSYLVTAFFSTLLITEATGNSGVLFSNPQPTEERWISAVMAQQEAIQIAHRILRDYDPVPPALRPLHEQMVDALGDCDQMAALTKQGTRQLNADRFGEAVIYGDRCSKKLNALTVQLKQAMKE